MKNQEGRPRQICRVCDHQSLHVSSKSTRSISSVLKCKENLELGGNKNQSFEIHASSESHTSV